MYKVYLLLGSNLGDREKLLSDACLELRKALLPNHLRTESLEDSVQISKIYETEPWGFDSNNKFLNMAFSCETELEPHSVLQKCLYIETALGRVRVGAQYDEKGERIYASRHIDIDILLIYKKEESEGKSTWEPCTVNTPDLIVPHPRLHEREFAKQALKDLM